MRRSQNPTLCLYAWDPLVIYSFAGSFAGGGHYDSWFILLVAGWLAFERRHWAWSALLIGLSVAIKWMSLPILVFLALQEENMHL